MALTKVSRGLLSTGIVDNSNATAITIDSSENVGIGTSSPSAGAVGGTVIHVQNSGGTASVRVDRSDAATSGTLSMTSANGSNGLFSTGAKPLVFATNSIERMRLTSAGRLVVNGTVAGYSGTDITVGSPSQAASGLSILTSTTGTGYVLFGDVTGDAAGGYSGQVNYNNSTNRMGFNTNNVERLAITDVGAIFATGVRSSSAANNDLRYNTSNGEIYYQTSSERYKSNIADLEFDTSNLYNLRPVSFDDNETGERCFGLIAEETFEQIPEAVVTRDIDGETVPDSIPYSMLSVLIINELKKLKVENDSLKARLTALENN